MSNLYFRALRKLGVKFPAFFRSTRILDISSAYYINDITQYPEGAKLDPFMYWDAEVEASAALALIKRYVVVTMSFAILVFLYRNLMLRDNQQHTS